VVGKLLLVSEMLEWIKLTAFASVIWLGQFRLSKMMDLECTEKARAYVEDEKVTHGPSQSWKWQLLFGTGERSMGMASNRALS